MLCENLKYSAMMSLCVFLKTVQLFLNVISGDVIFEWNLLPMKCEANQFNFPHTHKTLFHKQVCESIQLRREFSPANWKATRKLPHYWNHARWCLISPWFISCWCNECKTNCRGQTFFPKAVHPSGITSRVTTTFFQPSSPRIFALQTFSNETHRDKFFAAICQHLNSSSDFYPISKFALFWANTKSHQISALRRVIEFNDNKCDL